MKHSCTWGFLFFFSFYFFFFFYSTEPLMKRRCLLLLLMRPLVSRAALLIGPSEDGALGLKNFFLAAGRDGRAVSGKIIGCTGATPHIAHHLRSACELFSAAAPLTTEHQMWTSPARWQR